MDFNENLYNALLVCNILINLVHLTGCWSKLIELIYLLEKREIQQDDKIAYKRVADGAGELS